MAEQNGFEILRDKGDALLVIKPLPSHAPGSQDDDDDATPVKFKCHSTLLKLASPLLDDLLGSCCAAPAPAGKEDAEIELKLDGSPEAWLDILSLLYSTFLPQPQASIKRKSSSPDAACAAAAPPGVPVFSWQSAAGMLPILHKYDMAALLDRVVSWIGTQSMSGDARSPAYVLNWLDLSQALQLDALIEICHEQLSQLPLSLSSQHPSYVRTWLRVADERDLPSLQARCLALLNTGGGGGTDGGGAGGAGPGLQLSLEPGSEGYVLDLLSTVHTSGHFGDLQPLRKKCMQSIRKAAEEGSVQEEGGGGGGGGSGSRSERRYGRARSMVQELLHPAAAGDAVQPGETAGRAGAGADAARLDGLSALSEGLLSRSAAYEQLQSRMQGAREVYLCSNCGHGIAVFKPQTLKKMASWLRFVSSHSNAPATLPCPVCGNASCSSQPSPNDCKVMWAL